MQFISLQSVKAGLGTGDPNDRVIGTGTSGPSGIEGIIEFNKLLLNNRSWIDTYVVTDILGTDDADVRDSRENNPGSHGETPGNAFYGGRTISLQGYIETRTLEKLHDMRQALQGAFSDISVERPLMLHGKNINHTLYSMCKKSQKLDVPEKQETLNLFKRNFNITLRASMPWFVSYIQDYNEWAYNGSSSIEEVIFSPVNLGNFDSCPYIEITGPAINPSIINEVNSSIILFNGTIPDGETWVINFTLNSPHIYIKGEDQTPLWNIVDGISTSFLYTEFPSSNPIRFTATGLGVNSKVASWHRKTIL